MSEGGHQSGSLMVGERVEVRNAFDRAWASGFVVHDVAPDGYHLRRRSDEEVLPAVFPFDDVRRERRRELWWYSTTSSRWSR